MKNGALLIVVAGALVHFNANIVISPLVVVSGEHHCWNWGFSKSYLNSPRMNIDNMQMLIPAAVGYTPKGLQEQSFCSALSSLVLLEGPHEGSITLRVKM